MNYTLHCWVLSRVINCYNIDPVRGKTMEELRHFSVENIEHLKQKGYHVVGIWECDVNGELKQN